MKKIGKGGVFGIMAAIVALAAAVTGVVVHKRKAVQPLEEEDISEEESEEEVTVEE